MKPAGRPRERVAHMPGAPTLRLLWLSLLLLLSWATPGHGMTDDTISRLRQETTDIFYHGFDSYMTHAFPEDELKPLSCAPLTRDRANPTHIEVNDVLGNYSLTLIDSLSTLAILASSPPPSELNRNRPLKDFQDGIKELVKLYGDGTPGARGQGTRARGFDLDSKVQVFETVIRGVGGLLSAHQFAVGDLPIRGYDATVEEKDGRKGIFWPNGLVYDGQLLRLARDLAERIMPAFQTPTYLPYPRVNLRHGVSFYENALCNADSEKQCKKDRSGDDREITETCSAGAGSLVLEFSTLSRLTGDPRYERAAKAAFFAVWRRRSTIGLIGAGVDAETGLWVSSSTGIGAGVDSFFEYAVKSHILLSGVPYDDNHPDIDSPDAFLRVWDEAHDSIKRNIYRSASFQHPHYVQVDLYSGAFRAFWIDSLSAFYQGLLTLAGELEEAIETHLLHTALWSRYSAMPERWSTATGNIEHGLRWWGGRPEFIESTWYLYRATQDPWYLHVGEMAIRDIKRRCWTKCGWAGLQDIRTGELSDRMESFFLGETAKYLFLLFDPSHPLNTWDAPFVFTTEGHPLIIPPRFRQTKYTARKPPKAEPPSSPATCPLPPKPIPLTISATAARPDIFHAASLARLHQMPTENSLDPSHLEFVADHPSLAGVQSPSNYTFYPWTLPLDLIPHNATSSVMATRRTFDLSFPNMANTLQIGGLQRVHGGILIKSMSGVRLGMTLERDMVLTDYGIEVDEYFRVHGISNVALGRDEKVYLSRSTADEFNPLDPYFTKVRDTQSIELIVDAPPLPSDIPSSSSSSLADFLEDAFGDKSNPSGLDLDQTIEIEVDPEALETDSSSYLSSLIANLQSLLSATGAAASRTSFPYSSHSTAPKAQSGPQRLVITAALPIGPGAAPLPDVDDPDLAYSASNPLSWKSIYIHSNTLCDERLPVEVPRNNQIIVVPRGGCSFSGKLQNIPPVPPKKTSLQLVVVVSFPAHDEPGDTPIESSQTEQEQPHTETTHDDGDQQSIQHPADEHTLSEPDPEAHAPPHFSPESTNSKRSASTPIANKNKHTHSNSLVQPFLDRAQYTPSGLPRPNPIPLVMIGGGDDTMALLRSAQGVGVRRKYYFESQGVRIKNLVVL